VKLLTVLGARPQFVKAAMVSKAIRAETSIQESLVHTGQHYDKNMSALFFEEMMIPAPDFHLNVGSGSHAKMTGTIMSKLEDVCLEIKPDAVMVYGDTNSTLAAALCASKLHIPLVHVEAGLRSFNMKMPEEINRILTDRISSLLFCPTKHAIANLKYEGYANFPCDIILSGDVMLDAALFYSEAAAKKSTILQELGLERFVLCTIHRADNTDDPSRLKHILSALCKISEDQPVVVPLHPRTRQVLTRENYQAGRLRIIDPVGYFDMLTLIKGSSMILTDSGGLQKEAFFFAKPCITLRDETEWIELLEQKVNLLAGADEERILTAYRNFLTNEFKFDTSLYGEGKASSIIARRIEKGFDPSIPL
jgi:UDP-GlcNAc3NAcA epimerase